MKLSAAYQTRLLKEADNSEGLSHADIRARLCDALNDTLSGGQYGYVQDIFGDDKSGEVVYCCGGDMYKAPYEIGTFNGKAVASIDVDAAVDVVPRTIYEEEADETDYFTSMGESMKKAGLYTELPLYERFISKSERDSADESDFAGKGKSFPILKPGDIMAAVRSMGRAGAKNLGPSGIKSRIISIAKRKGWTKYLPKAWQGGSEDPKEALRTKTGELVLVESAATLETIKLSEAKADYEIKLIAPGKGSSAFYPKEVLQRDGPKVFRAGTHVYLNHPTAAEEASRPEGDVKNLAGVLTTDASYNESHAKGPGLYARMKVFADHAQTVEEKAAHVGMSIRASGKAESKKTHEGLPILTELTSAESVDVVTRAGAGGMILSESALSANPKEGADDMTAEDVKKVTEAAIKPFREKALRAEAKEKAFELLEAVTLPDIAKRRIVERAVASLELGESLDEKKLGEVVAAEAKSEGEYLASVTGSGRVLGMGATAVAIDPKEAKREKKALKEAKREAVEVFESLGLTKEQAKLAAKGREAA